MKKTTRKIWDFSTSLVVHIFLLVLSISMISGTLGLPDWLGSFVSGTIPIIVGWVLTISILFSLIVGVWDLVSK